jgi:hypothetical protein
LCAYLHDRSGAAALNEYARSNDPFAERGKTQVSVQILARRQPDGPRVLLVWTRLPMPNGRSIVLERRKGADPASYSGLEDEVDHDWNQRIGAVLLSTLLSVGSEVNVGATANGNNAVQALRRGLGVL